VKPLMQAIDAFSEIERERIRLDAERVDRSTARPPRRTHEKLNWPT
jgi:hypothetical protein